MRPVRHVTVLEALSSFMHITLLYIILGMAALVLVVKGVVMLRVAALRRAGIYPAAGQASMSDVERLLRAGHRGLAARCYREIHHCGLAEAQKAINDLHFSV